MFIKYENYELLELFLSEATSLTDNVGDGKLSYSKANRNGLKLTVFIHTYELRCGIYLSLNDESIFDTELKNITELYKEDNVLVFKSESNEVARIIFGDVFRISLLWAIWNDSSK